MYAELWHTSKCLLDDAIESRDNSPNLFLSSVVMTAFVFEAYLNHVGERTFACWDEVERLPPWSKFELLSEKLGVCFSDGAGARPLQTIAKLLNFRNTMAHGRSGEIHSKPITRTTANYHAAYHEELLTDWEQLARTKEFPMRAREDVRTVLERLHEARQDDKENLFTLGMGLHGATLVEEP
ncbi:MAG: hypothetical protein HYU79_01520 [Nitrosomonadales bacterium]|nr:hypothetical protein [Nitrosomonadales bacterium]